MPLGSGDLPPRQHGILILGTPLGHPDFVAARLEELLAEHRALLDKLPLLEDTQAAWFLLLASR